MLRFDVETINKAAVRTHFGADVALRFDVETINKAAEYLSKVRIVSCGLM